MALNQQPQTEANGYIHRFQEEHDLFDALQSGFLDEEIYDESTRNEGVRQEDALHDHWADISGATPYTNDNPSERSLLAMLDEIDYEEAIDKMEHPEKYPVKEEKTVEELEEELIDLLDHQDELEEEAQRGLYNEPGFDDDTVPHA